MNRGISLLILISIISGCGGGGDGGSGTTPPTTPTKKFSIIVLDETKIEQGQLL